MGALAHFISCFPLAFDGTHEEGGLSAMRHGWNAGVMSATSACYYLRSVVPNAPDVIGLTVGLLLLFALLCVMGLSESATVATGIFVIHMLTLMVLCVTTSIYAVKNGGGEVRWS